MKLTIKVIPLIIALVLNLLSQSITAYATSSYDAIVQTVSDWEVVDSLGVPHETGIEDAINNMANGPQKTLCQSAYAKFKQMDYRTFDQYQPSRYSDAKYARAFASDTAPESTIWQTNGPTKLAQSLWTDTVSIPLKYDEDNNKVIADGCGDGVGYNSLMTYALGWNDGFIPIATYLTEGFEVDWPSGYDGTYIPHANRTGLIQGLVLCSNTSNIISAVHIDVQSGEDGNAKISDYNIGPLPGKKYSYYLSEESPYKVVVLCDSHTFYGPTVNSDLYYLYNWNCTHTGDLYYCAAA